MANLKQSTAFTRTFLMVDSTDHVSPKTGLTVGVWLSKAGAAFTAVSGSVSEISFGWYKVALNATDTNTLGDLAFHCTGTAADLTDFNDQVTANILGDTLPANVTQWVGVAPNALISGTVDGNIHYPNPIIAVATGTVSANVIQWKGATPNDLITGTVDAFTHYSNPIPSFPTGTVNANVIQWASQNVPNPDQTGIPKVNVTNWLSGTVANPNLVGVPKIDLVDIDGLATNGNNATLNLKKLDISNSSDSAIRVVANALNASAIDILSLQGKGIEVVGDGGAGVRIAGEAGNNPGLVIAGGGFAGGMEIYGGSGGGGLLIQAGVASDWHGVEIYGDGTGHALHIQTDTGKSINAPQGIVGDIVGNITGSMTGNIYGDIHGYVGWVTGSVNANVLQWASQNVPTPSNTGIPKVNVTNWLSGSVSNPNLVGIPKVDLTDIDGLATNGNNAILSLKQLDINNGAGNAVRIQGNSGNGIQIIGDSVGGYAGVSIDGAFGIRMEGLVYNGLYIAADNGDAIYAESLGNNGHGLNLVGVGTGKSINASQGIVGDVVGNITGSMTGNIYGDIYGYVGWVTGSVQQVLISTPAAAPTGTINANVIQWIGATPNNLISGTVDAFVHYSNPVQAFVTGTIDANVELWRDEQPNILISGTVDAYAHYVADKTDYALTSAYNAAKTASQAGDAMTLTAGERISIADALLKRDWTAITGEASRSVLNALRFIRNKFSTTAHANKVTIYKEDDTSEAYQKDVTTDATADPIVEG